MLTFKLDLSNDHRSSDAVDPPSHALLVDRLPGSERNIFRGDLEKAGGFLPSAENRRKMGSSASSLAGNMKRLDQQLAAYESDLRRDVSLQPDECGKVATLVAADIRFLPSQVKDEIRAASPVPLRARYDELIAFQAWNDFASSIRGRPEVTRAQVVVQNYVCFGYLKDACFEVIAAKAKTGSVAERCARFLTSGAVRDFRNAFSHANWCYNSDFSGLNCWVLEDARKRGGPLRSFEVAQRSLNFWQTLSRGVAYATYEQVAS